ncbi:MAG: hypothetical protein COB12_10535 [Flavobacterium sp.]|nr:MAG: hypothetical protein COB12_10535 [Flavobacterium sp.]
MKKQIYRIATLFLVLITLSSCSGDDSSNETTPDESPNLTITTIPINNITQIKASSGGEISGGDNETIVSKGVVWSTNENPTLNDNSIEDTANNSSFTITITGLELLTTYYLRAYIKTTNETIYGNEISFSTLDHVVFNGLLAFATQAGIDGFIDSGVSKITYGIRIEENEPGNITNLDGLENLIFIGDDESNPQNDRNIIITNNSNLTNLSGLQNINYIDGSIGINNNPELNSIENIPQVTKLFGLGLSDLPSLSNIEPLSNLGSLGESLSIRNTGIQSLAGLQNIITIGGFLHIKENNSLINIDPLSNLSSVNDFVIISENNQLVNLDGFGNLQYVGTSFVIDYNNSLTDFCGITTLVTNNGIGGSFIISDNEYNPTQQDILDGNCSL